MLDQDDDGLLSKDELSTGLSRLGMGDGKNEALAGRIMEKADVDGDGLVSIEEWEAAMQTQAFQDEIALAVTEMDLFKSGQLRDILKYAFDQFDENGDGQISYEEFRIALGLVGMKLPPDVSKETFMKLSGGKDYIEQDNSLTGKMALMMSTMQDAFFERWKSEGFAKAEYTWNSVNLALARTDLAIPARFEAAVQAFWGQADSLSDFTETLADIIGIGFAMLSISNQLSCLPDCSEDGVDLTNLVPLVVLLRRTVTDWFKNMQDISVRDLNQDKAYVFAMVFKPAGFSVIDFQQIYEQGNAEWRTLPAGMRINYDVISNKLQLIARGSVKILNQSSVPGLSETSVVLNPGTFIGAANLMDNPGDGLEQVSGQYVSVMQDTLVLVWEGPALQRYFQVNTGMKQQFQVMLAKSIETTMGQVSQQAQKMAVELPILFRDFLLGVTLKFSTDRATLWIYDEIKDVLWTLFVSAEGKTSYVAVDASAGIAGCCFTQGSPLNIPDCYQDDRFNTEVDKQTGYYTKSTLCVPVFADKSKRDEKAIGVVQFVNKLKDGERVTIVRGDKETLAHKFTHFTEADERKAEQSLWLTSLMIQQLSRRYNTE